MLIRLASASPRRLELLKQVGCRVLVTPTNFDESINRYMSPEKLVINNAIGKAECIVKIYGDEIPVVAADTIVVFEDKILEKPKDSAEAKTMLKLLSGNAHDVLTGLAINYCGKKYQGAVTTKVWFSQLSSEEIDTYVATGEPLDKAGAYGIQGIGALLVEKIDGCYYNVVGLPLTRLYKVFREMGADFFAKND